VSLIDFFNINNDKYKIKILSESYQTQVVALLSTCFYEEEPLTYYLDVSQREYFQFITDVVKHATLDRLSLIAVDQGNNVIACCIAENFNNPFRPDTQYYPGMVVLFDFLHTLQQNFTLLSTVKNKKILHITMTAVDKKLHVRGISKNIDFITCKHAAERYGFDFVYAEVTNQIRKKVIETFDIMGSSSVTYESYIVDGYQPFNKVNGSATAYLIPLK